MFCDRIAGLRFLIKELTVYGLWPVARNASTLFGRYYRYYQFAVNITMTFSITLLMWIEIMLSEDIDTMFHGLALVITETCLIIKVVNIWHYAHAANELLLEWDGSDMFSLKTVAEQKMWQGAQQSFRRVLIGYTAISNCSLWFSLCGIFFKDTITLPIPIWLPAGWRANTAWPIYVYEFVVMQFTCICNTQLDLFLCYLSLHLALCLRLIGMRMERVGAQENDREITNEFESIIKLHQRVKCMAKGCERIIMLPVLTHIIFSSLIICFCIYSLQHRGFGEDPSRFLSYVQYAIAMSMQIFLPCYYANEITIESQSLSSHLYNCDWTGMSVYNRRLIFTYMESLKEPIVLYAGNYFEIGLPVFSKTMNNAYSLLALLANVDTEEK